MVRLVEEELSRRMGSILAHHDMTTVGGVETLVEIINRVRPWAGSVQQAFAWYRSQPLPSFGDQTAEDLVKQGRAEAVKTYLSRLAVGGYA